MPLSKDIIAAAPRLAAGIVRDWVGLAGSVGWIEAGKAIDEDHLTELIQKLGEAAVARS